MSEVTSGRQPPVYFPVHALLVVEERLAEHEAEGFSLPAACDRTELALRILVTVEMLLAGQVSGRASG